MKSALSPEQLYTACDHTQFGFKSTADLDDIDVAVGQTRALESLRFGLRVRGDGYNIFALGPSGTGKLTATRQLVEELAVTGEAPSDWCYVQNFAEPHKPNAICLPAGTGARLRTDMYQFVEDLQIALPAAFESEDYRARLEEIDQSLKERQQEMMDEAVELARTKGLVLVHTQTGFAFAPKNTEGDEVLPREDFMRLPAAEQAALEEAMQFMQQKLQRDMRKVPAWAKEAREQVKSIGREIAENVVEHALSELKLRYGSIDELADYLSSVASDVIENVQAFLPNQQATPFALASQGPQGEALRRYRVNLLVDNTEQAHAPVIYEDLPSYVNLIGRTEHQAQMGTLVTDFTLIKPGALHRANGGYLILDARQVLLQPLAWDGLKRALQAREVRLDSLERSLSFISTVSLEPEHIPLNVKVVLVGDRRLYYMLSQFDPDFADLFKVMADFNDVADRNAVGNDVYAGLFATLCRSHELRALNPAAVSRVIEYAARIAEDSEKVTTHVGQLTDLLREADHWAGEADCDLIERQHVQRAIDQLIYRAERVRERQYENINRGTIMIDTAGAVVGQINGLSVLQLGQFRFGQPSRITATTRLGDGKVIDIERETDLGGPIHSKGVLIMSSYLANVYAQSQPLSVSASLVFEQSYGMVDGDSASLAELCALLSSLSRVPIQQRFAVTGSVNQHGDVQPIGGANEKIEGFFDVCKARTLTGDQGVLIPASNVKHLMLREDVVQAVRDGKFHIYAVSNINDAIELLTQTNAGEMAIGGYFPADSINGKVSARIAEFGATRQRLTDRSGRGH